LKHVVNKTPKKDQKEINNCWCSACGERKDH